VSLGASTIAVGVTDDTGKYRGAATLTATTPTLFGADAPVADGGTAALVRRPPDVIEARFGADSAARHRATCEEAGVALCEPDLPSLHLDLDRVADVEAFLATGRGGPRTRAALDAIGWRTLIAGDPGR